MKLKIFLISLLISMPFWWEMDVFSKNLEVFLFKNQILTAEVSQKIITEQTELLKSERERREYLENLKIDAKAAISVEIKDKNQERILFEKNSQEPLPIASLTKLMTALIIFDLTETYDFSQPISITKSVGDLLFIMLIESSNDAALALTEPIGEEGFVDLMNLYAKDIGLKDTLFVDSTGLDPGNISSVRDLVILARYIIDNYPQIFEITIHQQYGTTTNTNKLLAEVPGIIGGKTGWTIEAGGCLLLVLENPNGSGYFINIILGSDDRFGEMRQLINAIK